LLAHPAGRGLFRRGDSYSPALLALAAVAAVPLLAFAVNQLSLSGSATDPHAVDGHYVMMVGLAIAPIAYGAFAAFGFTGWRLAAWLAAFPMSYYGAMSIAFPAQSGSTGTLWGAAAIGWAIAFVLVAEYARVAPENTTLRREFARAG
jgi:Ca2+/Na+ antiporter